MIEVQGLTKRFKHVTAVTDVSFTARDGEIMGILGPNGAGKTTLLRMLTTLLPPTAGTAQIDGLNVSRQAAQARRHIGLLVESGGLYSRFTPREHLLFYGRLQGLNGSAIEARVQKVIDMLEMSTFADRRADSFSAGMQRRVLLAQALLHDPPNLVLDEPTASLDVMSTRTVRALIAAMRDQGRCVLLSTHLMDEVERLCDRVVVLHQGQVRAVATPQELQTRTGADSLEEAFVRLVGEDSLRDALWRPPERRRWWQVSRRKDA
ncbi:MAG: ATP-binding cassette domain-containing protein [Anaerolineae bacterium]|nr:ATP-binding cassette domain-containing protein [Anaerolineae bacterium]